MKTLLALLLLIPSLSWGFLSNPLEKCMNRVIDGTYEGDESRSYPAARVCKGADKSVLKCIDRVIKGTMKGDKKRTYSATKTCNGS